jgi:hypothetical protein
MEKEKAKTEKDFSIMEAQIKGNLVVGIFFFFGFMLTSQVLYYLSHTSSVCTGILISNKVDKVKSIIGVFIITKMCRWLTTVILAGQEAEIRRISVQSQHRQIVQETLS